MLQWETDLPTAQVRAERERKFLLIDFAKDPCPDCAALDTLTFTDTRVQALIAAHVVPLHLLLGRHEDQQLFRSFGVFWTPTLVVADRRGRAHYQSAGFLPPAVFVPTLQVGLAHALNAWARYAEAEEQLATVAASGSALAPEAWYWLGATRYLRTHDRAPMLAAWQRLCAEYPTSAWAARVAPGVL